MKRHYSKELVILSAVLVFILACEIPALAPAASSDPASVPVGTIIAGTANAAQTQTAVFMPSPTQTETAAPTQTEVITETPTPAPTETVIFIIPTATETFNAGSVGNNCQLIAIRPYNPIAQPGQHIDIIWTLKNTGNQLWLNSNVDFKYVSGRDMHKKDIYDLKNSVPPGIQFDLTVEMIAPSKSGSYKTNWVLTTGKETLCSVSAMIIVQ